eukprot:6032307-Prymnesium_polylepis.1
MARPPTTQILSSTCSAPGSAANADGNIRSGTPTSHAASRANGTEAHHEHPNGGIGSAGS